MARKKAQPDSNATPAKVGRPSDYNLEIATRICEAIATCTDSYNKICERNPDFPTRENMRLWRYRHLEFRGMYDQAKKEQAELIIEEIVDIADYIAADTLINPKTGQEVQNTEWVARSRLRIDTRKWIACKLLPKLYGDKAIEPESKFTDAEKDELRAIMAGLMVKHEREY